MNGITIKSTSRLQPHWGALLLPLYCLMQSGAVSADDVAAPTQKIGNHATVATTDGEIRDDELVDFICEKINDNGGKVKDVKLMVNSCYGGGLLDDMERAFGSGGACEGISWVGGTASGPEEPAKGWGDKTVNGNPEDKLGSTWTDGLAGNSRFNEQTQAGVIRNGSATNNVLQDFQATVQNDDSGPNGDQSETPQVASGNSGDKIQWNMEGAKHEAVVFGGLQTNQRHHNNIENVETALNNTWKDAPHTIQAIDGGSTMDLKDAIEIAAGRLDENTQLVIYIDDHGGSSFDFDEAIGGIANILIEDEESWNPEVPDGWIDGTWGNSFNWPPDMPTPTLNLDITDCDNCSSWGFFLNDDELPFPGGDRTGRVTLPIEYHNIRPGSNLLQIVPRQSSMTQRVGAKPQTHLGKLVLSRMELSTGPINELMAEQVLLPGQSAAFFDPDRNGEGIFVELLDNQLALVYIFTYNRDGTGQAWMIGLGKQVGEGIIIHDMLEPSGARFGPDFDPNDVVRASFGTLVFKFPTCGTSEQPGTLFVYPDTNTNYDVLGSHNYQQLTKLVDCETSVGSADSPLSGSWFDPTHDGEGIILEVLENGTTLVQWFTYDGEGKQMWMQGTGTITGNILTVDNLFTTLGPEWGDGFDPDKVTVPHWGVLTMEFTGCGEALVNYDSSAGFGVGTLNMVRLTNLMGITCVP